MVKTPPATRRDDDRLGSERDKSAVDPVVAEGANHPVAIFQQPGQCDLHVDLDAELDEAVLQAADHFQASAITDVAEPSIRVGAEGSLQNAAVGRPVEDRAVGLELVHTVWRLAGVQLRHPPVVDHLTAAHGVLEMHLPVVVRVDVAEGRGNPALGHHGVRLPEQRLADHGHPGARGRRLDGRAHAGTTGADHEYVRRQRLEGLAQKITLGS